MPAAGYAMPHDFLCMAVMILMAWPFRWLSEGSGRHDIEIAMIFLMALDALGRAITIRYAPRRADTKCTRFGPSIANIAGRRFDAVDVAHKRRD